MPKIPTTYLREYLYAPAEYWNLPEDIKAKLCNGCGAAGKRDYIPDRLLGLDITEICHIHDYMYAIGRKLGEKRDADQAFLDNLITVIDIETPYWWLRVLRRWMALRYYRAVMYFGGPAFWAGKISKSEIP